MFKRKFIRIGIIDLGMISLELETMQFCQFQLKPIKGDPELERIARRDRNLTILLYSTLLITYIGLWATGILHLIPRAITVLCTIIFLIFMFIRSNVRFNNATFDNHCMAVRVEELSEAFWASSLEDAKNYDNFVRFCVFFCFAFALIYPSLLSLSLNLFLTSAAFNENATHKAVKFAHCEYLRQLNY